MENETIIRHRLLTGTSTTRGEPPLKKLALAYGSTRTVTKWLIHSCPMR